MASLRSFENGVLKVTQMGSAADPLVVEDPQ